MQLLTQTAQLSYHQQQWCAELIDLHEANYLRLSALLPDMDDLGEHAVSTAAGGLDMHFRLLERCKYTLTFSLSYRFDQFDGADGPCWAPDLQVRMYRDAQLAEVISGVLHRHAVYRSDAEFAADQIMVRADMNQIYARWRLNRFLYRWLGFCLKQGHCFQQNLPLNLAQQQILSKLQLS